MWTKFSWKVTSGQIIEEKGYDTNAFLWENFVIYFYLSFGTNFDASYLIKTKIKLKEPLRRERIILIVDKESECNSYKGIELVTVSCKTFFYCPYPPNHKIVLRICFMSCMSSLIWSANYCLSIDTEFSITSN
jgi:hypothetical protein